MPAKKNDISKTIESEPSMAAKNAHLESEAIDYAACESIAKTAVKPFVSAVLNVYTAFLIVVSYSFSWDWVLVLVITGYTAWFNTFMLHKTFSIRIPGRRYSFTPDQSDAIRWLINIAITEIPLSFLLNVSTLALAGFWTLVGISIIAELHQRRYRYAVYTISLVSSIVCILLINPNIDPSEMAFWVLNQVAIGAFFESLETHWVSSILNQIKGEKRLKAAVTRADSMFRNALVGEHAQIIAHEVANLTMSLDFAMHNERKVNVQAIRSSLNYLQRVTRLVLDDIQAEAFQQICQVGDLIHDINVIIGKQVSKRGIKWKLIANEEVKSMLYSERSGSSYLCLQNIVKNACEAIEREHSNVGSGIIELRVFANEVELQVTVTDNGGGLDTELKAKLLRGSAESRNPLGHGLGMRFVYSECYKNEFRLIVESTQKIGSTIGFGIPLKSISIQKK